VASRCGESAIDADGEDWTLEDFRIETRADPGRSEFPALVVREPTVRGFLGINLVQFLGGSPLHEAVLRFS